MSEYGKVYSKGNYVTSIRYTEILLINIEANSMAGNINNALTNINKLKIRRDEDVLQAVTNDDIYNQWLTELYLEGCSFRTMKRFGKAQSALAIFDYKLLLPIPQFEIDGYQELTQNPGY